MIIIHLLKYYFILCTDLNVFIFKNTKDKQETSCITDTKEHNATTQRNLELQACCIPGCINSADYLNEHGNAKPGSFSIFTPSSIVNYIFIIIQNF